MYGAVQTDAHMLQFLLTFFYEFLFPSKKRPFVIEMNSSCLSSAAAAAGGGGIRPSPLSVDAQ